MLRRIVLSVIFLITLPVLAQTNTNTFISKAFQVANINTNPGTGNLVGNVTIENTNNTPFFVVSNANFNVPSGQTQAVVIGFYTTGYKYGFYTNRFFFVSNGGNTTNGVSGTLVPKSPATFKFN